MTRTKIKEALQASPGKEIVVKGWVRAFRSKRFVALNDGSSLANLQGVVDFENFDEAIVSQITVGSAIAVTGDLIESQGAGQSVEVAAKHIEILGTANPDEVAKTILQPKRHSLELLREQAHLRFRTQTFSAVFRIRHAMAFAIHKYFNDNGFYYLHTPIITGSDAEGVGEMFRVTTLPLDNVPKVEDHFAKEILQNTREMYCSPREEVEKLLSKWDEAGEFDEGNVAPEYEKEFEEPLI